MNSSRMNRLEELGRVDAEKADTKKGKKNLSEEKSRIVRELKAKGGKISGNKSQQNLTGKNFYKKSKPKASGSRGRTKRKFANGGMVTVSGRGQGKVLRKRPTFNIHM